MRSRLRRIELGLDDPIPQPRVDLPAFCDYSKEWLNVYVKVNCKHSTYRWVFCIEGGNFVNEYNFRRRKFYPLITKAKLRKFRIHDLRHTYALIMLQNGESPTYVKGQMGHHSIQITVDTYGHLIPGANRAAVNRLGSVIFAAQTESEQKAAGDGK